MDWERSILGRDFIFGCVYLLYKKFHKINLSRGGSYTDYFDWIKNKKAPINPIEDDEKCFQYTATVAANLEEIGTYVQRISKINFFINK